MKFNFTAICCLFMLIGRADGQQFMNGSFENNGTLAVCMQNDTALFNSTMGFAWLHTGPNKIYFGDTSCSTPAHGNYYIGLLYTGFEGGSNLILRLASPMIAGTKYKFSFSYKKSVSSDAALLFVGYNNPADSFGHDSFVNILPAPTATSWTTVTDSITPAINTPFIYIRAATMGSSPLVTYVDNFSMLGVPPLTTARVISADEALNIYPNPVAGEGRIVIGNEVAAPYSVCIYDISGRTMLRKDNCDQRQMTLGKQDLASGAYFIRLVDNDGNVLVKKLFVQ